jgi:hypothetical protein
VALIVLGATAVGVLHLVPPSSRLDPHTRTISEYALLSNGWVFDAAVLAIAAGSAAAVSALLLTGLLHRGSLALLGLGLWCAAMVGVVAFPKHNWARGGSPTGDLHRAASLTAFIALPVAAVLLGMAWRRHERWRTWARGVLWLGVASVAAFSPLLYAIVSAPLTGVRWWRVFPLGTVERILAATEVVTILAIGVWAARAALARSGTPRTAEEPARYVVSQ